MMLKLPIGLFVLLAVAAMIPLAVIAFSAPASPPAMASMEEPFRQVAQDFPAPRHFKARDGAGLQYYAYPAAPDKVAVLVHGSAGPGTSMHGLAESLRGAGVTAYVLDIRGHGGSGRRGDIDYIGQLDDDLADFVAQLGPAKNGEIRTLVGFSAGAGFTMRFAGGPYGPAVRPLCISVADPAGVARAAPERRRLDQHFRPAHHHDRFAWPPPRHSLVRRIARHQLCGVARKFTGDDGQLFLSAGGEFRRRTPA
jgi:pimeloyl-ACP methyl ester carboxylesterase